MRETKEEKMAKYAKILDDSSNDEIWGYLESSYGIKGSKFKDHFGFAKSNRGRLWIGSRTALEFIRKEQLDPAKVLTVAMGKTDSAKLLRDQSMLIRLTLDGTLFFNHEITKNLLTLSENEVAEWNKGKELERDIENGVYILTDSDQIIIGSTIAKDGRLMNFIPKWRRWPRPN